jgi:glycosyltransferase involved in cell wall biosynthesis
MITKRTESPLVSVVIPNHNYGQFLEQCILSVLGQSYRNLEIIIVDDGSTDDSINIANKYKDDVIVYSQANRGVNAARNLGIAKSKGKLISLCDSDDYWAPEKIEEQVALLQANPDVGLVYCSYDNVNQNGNFVDRVHATHFGELATLFISFPTQALICGGSSTALFDRHAVSGPMFFDETLRGNAEDWDFFRRLCQTTRVGFVDKPLVFVRKHKDSRGGRSLDTFYAGNRASIIKAASDNYYSWTFCKRWQFFARFELLFFKSYLRKGKLRSAIVHLSRAANPAWQYKTIK